jgi:hypothetical protein
MKCSNLGACLIVGGVTMGKAQIIVFTLQIQVRKDELVFDHLQQGFRCLNAGTVTAT